MLKLNASFSKKVPAETDYSSKSYHASVEVELPDGLNDAQLKDRIHQTFELVQSSVEAEINGGCGEVQAELPQAPQQANPGRNRAASQKQIGYLLDLGRQTGRSPSALAAMAGVRAVEEMTRQQCSHLIDELGKKAA